MMINDPYLARLAQIESNMNPMAANPKSSAKGLFQFIDSTAKQYGLQDPFNPQQSIDAATRFTADNRAYLRKALGREPTAGELYLAHQQGAGGAVKLLANPQARAADIVGLDAIALNRGTPDMTAGDFANQWISKFEQPQVASDTFTSGGSQNLNMAMQEISDEELAKIAGVELPKQEISDEELAKIAGIDLSKQEPTQPQEKGVIGKLGEDLQARANKQAQIMQSTDNPLSKALQVVGNVGASVGDLGTAAYRGVMSVAPENVKRGESALLDILTPTAKKVGQAAEPVISPIQKMAQEHPEAARNVEALLGISQLAPFAKPLGKATEAVGKGVIAAPKVAATGAIKATLPKIAEETVPLVKRAQQFDIPLDINQVAPSRARNTIQKISQEMPFSGVGARQDVQVKAWNKALAQKALGIDAENLAPDNIKKFLEKSSKDFSEALGAKPIVFSADNMAALDEIPLNAPSELRKDLVDIVQTNVDKIKKDISIGAIDPEKLSNIRSGLVKKLPNIDSGARGTVSEIIDWIDSVVEPQIGAKQVEKLKQTRRFWRNYKTIDPLLEKSTNGQINPTDLMQKVASSKYIDASASPVGKDDLVDLARIGKEFLPKLGGSDTFQKTAYTIGTTAGLANPITGLQTASALAANRAYQSLYNQSPALLEMALQKSKVVKPTSAGRALLELTGKGK